jgi:thiamine-monophosphate kinase
MKKEMDFVNLLIKEYPRTSMQKNKPFTSDAEIIEVENGYISVSVDAVSEEIDLGLILSPKTLGFMTVTASVSDLAAIGIRSNKISVLLSLDKTESLFANEFFLGVDEAMNKYGITELEKVNLQSSQKLAACTAYGFSKVRPKISRVLLKPNDTLYLSGPIGHGNATAFTNIVIRKQNVSAADQIDQSYRPLARLDYLDILNKFSTTCIDTSDGLLATIKWLEILNKKKIIFNFSENIFHPLALKVSEITKVEPWLFSASQNGEFELLFSVSDEQKSKFEMATQKVGLSPIEIGRVEEGRGVFVKLDSQTDSLEKKLDIDELLDMLQEGVAPDVYIRKMLEFGKTNQIHF